VVRGEVTKVLEAARIKKLIGHPLDAGVTLSAKADLYNALRPYSDDLRSIFIVSKVKLVKDQLLQGALASDEVDGLSILVELAPGQKCERCWVHDTTVGTDAQQPAICDRCRKALSKMN
jgi:isoleucyl-tRNA synthetase